MSTLNIKGVTSGYTRHLGGDIQNTTKRTLTGKGYSQAMKKAFGVSSANEIKKKFKQAGIKTNRFTTSEKIKEVDFLADLKNAHKAGILNKSYEQARSSVIREQKKEHLSLASKEKKVFQNLSSKQKTELLQNKSIKSHGARLAAKKISKKDLEPSTTKFGIQGYNKLTENKDLGKKIRLLKDVKNKTSAVIAERKKLERKKKTILSMAKNNPNILKKYGLIEIEKAETEKPFLDEKEANKDNSKSKNTKAIKPTSNTTQTNSNAYLPIEPKKQEQNIELPFSTTDNFIKPTNKQAKDTEDSTEKTDENISQNKEEKISDENTHYGFIGNSGDVDIDLP